MAKFSLKNIRLTLQKLREGKRIVLTGGTFDIIHPGHVDYLEWCKRQGDILVVCVIGDKRTRRRKQEGRPMVKQEWRALMVSALKPVDLVFVSDRRPFEEQIIRAIRPEVVVTPADEPNKETKTDFASYFRSRNPDIELIMRDRGSFPRKSSTRRIIAKIRETFEELDR